MSKYFILSPESTYGILFMGAAFWEIGAPVGLCKSTRAK